MDKATKQSIIEKFGKSKTDSGSTEVQIAILTKKIEELTEHMRANKKDNSTRYGLLAMVNKRRKLLKYLNGKSHDSYMKLTEELKIRR